MPSPGPNSAAPTAARSTSIARHPGITVAGLLAILKITKQSLNRVLNELLEAEYVERRTSSEDGRMRQLRLTAKGVQLETALWEAQRPLLVQAFKEGRPRSRGRLPPRAQWPGRAEQLCKKGKGVRMTAEDAHLLVVDDDERLRALLQRFLTGNGFRVSVAADAAGARALMKSFSFDLLIVDVMMPGETGIELTRAVRQALSVPILMLTARGEGRKPHRRAGERRGRLPRQAFRAARAGSAGAVRCCAAAAVPAASPHREVTMGEAVFDPERGELRRKGKPVKLTSAEMALLKLFATYAGKAFSRSDLCTRLGVALERSIDVQVTRLRRKIEDDPKLPLYLQTVRGVGYVLVPDRVA